MKWKLGFLVILLLCVALNAGLSEGTALSAAYENAMLTVTASSADAFAPRMVSILVDGTQTKMALSRNSLSQTFSYYLANGNHVISLYNDMIGTVASCTIYVDETQNAEIGSEKAIAMSKAGVPFIDPSYPDLYLQYVFADEPDNDEITGLVIIDADKDVTSVTIPDGVTGIGDWAFCYCTGLTSIAIPDSVTSIGDEAFYDCASLTSVTIPDSITNIGEGAFIDCASLTSINVASGNSAFFSENSVLYNKYILALICCPGGKTGSYTIPDSVASIGDWAFYDCTNLTNVSIPDSVTSIGDWAFSGCTSLTSFSIPDSVTSIGRRAFSGCTGLTSITIPNSVTSIGKDAFYGCTGLTGITIPDSVTSIGEGAFSDCTGLTSITIPDSVTSIGEAAFSGCSSLTSVTIPDSVISIGYGAFSDCTGLTNIAIPDSVASIGNWAFGCTGLTSIAIPDRVTSIGDYLFYGCTGLTSIAIPDSVTSIGDYTFCYCTSLTDVYYGGTEEAWAAVTKGANNDSLINATIHYDFVPHDHHWGEPMYSWNFDKMTVTATRVCADDPSHKETETVGTVYEVIVSPTTETRGEIRYTSFSFENAAFSVQARDMILYALDSTKLLRLPAYLETIEAEAFAGAAFEAVIVPDGCTAIGSRAFADCPNLFYVRIPASVTSIAEDAFEGCGQVVIDRAK